MEALLINLLKREDCLLMDSLIQGQTHDRIPVKEAASGSNSDKSPIFPIETVL
jgi:hypothetical protein